jgi:hypothetical protein
MSDHAKDELEGRQDPMEADVARGSARPDDGDGETAADQTAGKSGGNEGPGDPGLDAANPVEAGGPTPGEPESQPDSEGTGADAALPSDAKGA